MNRILWLVLFLCVSIPAWAQDYTYGFSLYDNPKYSAGFTHYDYVNPDAPKGGELRQFDLGTFDNVNPFILKGLAAAGSDTVFETLMDQSMDEPLSQYGWVAESVSLAPDRSWISFKLRPEARFHDGSPITPEDVIFSFEVLRDKGHPSYRSYFKGVSKVEKLGPYEVKFTFRDLTNKKLPFIVGRLPIFSAKYWQGKDFTATTFDKIMGSGPYEIDAITPGSMITYKRVKDWWAKDLPINRGRYNFDTLRFDYYRDSTVALESFFAGQYDFRLENRAKDWATAYKVPAVQEGLIKKEEIKNELPSGMQGFVFNLRRPLFQDRRVRLALNYALDFEWLNKNIAFGAYTRTQSYFENSELASKGLPSPEEVKLLEPYRGKIPDEIFTQQFKLPVTDGSGDDRDNLHKAADLLREAGWVLKDGKLVNAKGEPFKFEIIDTASMFERWVQPFIRNLERLGIQATYRNFDAPQFKKLTDDFDYDMVVNVFGASIVPGLEERNYWSSEMADVKGSDNVVGVKDPVIDELLEKLVHTNSRTELITICHALDRVLLWQYYVIPHWYIGTFRVAYWDMFDRPTLSPKYGLDVVDAWWLDTGKAEKIAPTQKRNR